MDRVDYQSLIIQDLLNDHSDEKLNLNPWYQRRSVWSRPQKSYLINTLLERKPIPALYIRHSVDLELGKSIKEVVDGQQRSRSIIEFCADEFTTRLPGTKSRKRFSQLTRDQRERFLLTPIPVGVLLGATDEDVIDIFGRINSVSKSLNAQEKRNSKHSGEFKQFSLSIATRYLKFWREAGIFTANDIARMNEVQFIADLIFNLMNGVSDFRPSALDKLYIDNDEEFEREDEISNRIENVMKVLLEIEHTTFKDTIFRRQPIFFSLFLALDASNGITSNALKTKLHSIDAEFEDDDAEGEDIVVFRDAVASSTQRLTSRNTRHTFLTSRI